jgi:hypothetical protein
MKLPTIDEVERSVGGRPKVDNPKVRVSCYLNPNDAERLRIMASSDSISMSMFVRLIVKSHINECGNK